MMDNNFFDMPIRCSSKGGDRWQDCTNCRSYTTAREIWSKAPKAAARKATAPGVNGIAIDETGGKFYIYQIGGYTPERGAYCDILNELGQVVTP